MAFGTARLVEDVEEKIRLKSEHFAIRDKCLVHKGRFAKSGFLQRSPKRADNVISRLHVRVNAVDQQRNETHPSSRVHTSGVGAGMGHFPRTGIIARTQQPTSFLSHCTAGLYHRRRTPLMAGGIQDHVIGSCSAKPPVSIDKT